MILRTFPSIALVLLLAACGVAAPSGPSQNSTPDSSATIQPSAASPQTLTIFAAASLTEAFGEVGKSFEAGHPGVNIMFNFAGSQTLRTQIEQGAPADVMASADLAQMDMLVSAGYVDQAAPQLLLTNRLVVILPSSNPARLERLEDLAEPGLKLVMAAADVPVGKYARQSLDAMNSAFGNGFEGRVLSNVVSNEDNVKQVVAKVELGEADAGIVYTSDAIAAPDLRTIEIPPALNVTAQYAIAPLTASRNAALASEFVQYALSPAAQSVLAKWGFTPQP